MSKPDFLPHSGWADRPTNVAPSIADDLTCEVAVVGGSLGGMAAARRLAELGRDVVLVESDVCGWSASARNAGYVTGTIGSDPRILSRFYKERARGLYLFARNAVTFTEDLIADEKIDCDYEPTGIFSAAATAWGARRMISKLTSTKRSRVLSAEQAGVPPAFNGG